MLKVKKNYMLPSACALSKTWASLSSD